MKKVLKSLEVFQEDRVEKSTLLCYNLVVRKGFSMTENTKGFEKSVINWLITI